MTVPAGTDYRLWDERRLSPKSGEKFVEPRKLGRVIEADLKERGDGG